MAFSHDNYLSISQITEALSPLDDAQLIIVERIRYKNKIELRSQQQFSVCALKKFVAACIENKQQPGGDLEVVLNHLNKKLVGHHDGVYWFEDNV